MHARWFLAIALAACHVRSTVTTTTPGARHDDIHTDQVRPLAATIMLAPDGRLRFVEPLRCASDVYVELDRTETVHVDPNLATVVVGIVVAAAGVITVTRGLATGSGTAELLGGGGLIVGAPFAIAPWFGNGDVDRDLGTQRVRKGADEVPCGERPVVARTASVRSGRFQAFGAVDGDGEFEVSPFTFVDAFAPGDQPALDLTADLVSDAGIQTITAVLDASTLADKATAFLDSAKIDARVEPMRKVPNLDLGALKVSSLTVDGRPRLRVVVPVHNDGPGDAWQLRGIVSSDDAELDGRIVYIGHLGKGESAEAELLIPLSAAADKELSGADLELEVQLKEANGGAPADPARFRGRVLADVPR